ncbi:MAG: S8 family serine peptidase [Planctomycetota bacterium]
MLHATLLLAAVAAPHAAESSPSNIIPELRQAFAESPEGETFRVYAALDERLSFEDFAGKVEGLPRGERQQFVEDTLRSFADARQGQVLSLLSHFQSTGEVEFYRQLWITNTVKFQGTQEAIETIARLPEVDYVGWVPARETSEYTDATPAPVGPPAGGGGFTTFYTQDFEGGTTPAGVSSTTTGCGFSNVTSLYGPKTGSFHLVMASTTDSCDSTATTTLVVDLSGVPTAKLQFQFKDMSDEFNPGLDVLEASDDGINWVFVGDLTGSDGSYLNMEYDLDPLGITYDSDVYLRWSWADNFAPETDGFGIDDIVIADGFPPPPPPTAEPNLVQLQATALWDLGINGDGAILMNIDDGTDLDHPDLINRIWVNPLDPPDGIDNDNNGYIDDSNGWDFVSNDNNPDAGSHGTNTAGIMVGDGSSGLKLTGMAPGARLVVGRISGEDDHWEALQYGISVGIDCSSSSFSYKWPFSPKPDYHMHRSVSEMLLAAGIIHANSIGNQGGSPSYPIPFNISAPGNCPSPWFHPSQTQVNGRVAGTMACGGIELDDSVYSPSGIGPAAWENILTYDSGYPHSQNPAWFDYPYGGFSGGQQGLLKPDVVTYTNVATTSPGGGHSSSFGGTSAATPHLGGALALMISAQPLAEPRHISQALQRTAEDLGTPGKDNDFGAGKIQVLDAAMRLFHILRADDLGPNLGDTVNVAVDGQPGDYYAALWSTSLGSTATPVGTLDLGANYFVLNVAQLDGAGSDSIAVPIPTQPTLIGLDVHIQSVEDNLAGTFGDYLFSVVESLRIFP